MTPSPSGVAGIHGMGVFSEALATTASRSDPANHGCLPET